LKNKSDLVDLETITLVQGKGTGREGRGRERVRGGKGRRREGTGKMGGDCHPPLPFRNPKCATGCGS